MQRNPSGIRLALKKASVRRRVFFCPECPYTSNRRNNLLRHRETMHRDRGLGDCCGISFQDKAQLRQHNREVHCRGFSCGHCPLVFSRRSLLRRHGAVHDGIKSHLCRHCDYSSSHKSNLHRHIFRLHTTRCYGISRDCLPDSSEVSSSSEEIRGSHFRKDINYFRTGPAHNISPPSDYSEREEDAAEALVLLHFRLWSASVSVPRRN